MLLKNSLLQSSTRRGNFRFCTARFPSSVSVTSRRWRQSNKFPKPPTTATLYNSMKDLLSRWFIIAMLMVLPPLACTQLAISSYVVASKKATNGCSPIKGKPNLHKGKVFFSPISAASFLKSVDLGNKSKNHEERFNGTPTLLDTATTSAQYKVTNRRLNGRYNLPRPICCRVTIDPDRWTPGGCKASDEGQHLRRWIFPKWLQLLRWVYISKMFKTCGNHQT